MKIKRPTIFAFLFLISNLFSAYSPAYAWKLPIEVATYTDTSEKIYNKLVVGIEHDATNDFDNLWDTPAILSHPDPGGPPSLRAYITPTPSLILQGEGEKEGGDMDLRLWKDIRGPAEKDTIWDITVDSVSAGSIVVSWEMPQGLLKTGERLVLKDNDRTGSDGEPIETDVTQKSSYAFVSNSGGPRSLSLVLSKESSDSTRTGSGFGCGTVRSHKDGPYNDGGGVAIISSVALFLPIVVMRLWRRLTHLRLSI